MAGSIGKSCLCAPRKKFTERSRNDQADVPVLSVPSIALALGGGGARGIAHIHVFEALDELGLKPVAIAGTSIGAVMGAGYAAGMSGAAIRDYTLKTFRHRQELLAKLWQLRPESLNAFLPKMVFASVRSTSNGSWRFSYRPTCRMILPI